MAFLEQNPVGCKTVVGNKYLQKVKNFKYLDCKISYENKKNIQQKKLLNTRESKQQF